MPDKQNNTLEYIDAYFTQELSSEERKHFEMRCEQDTSFAKDVAFYLTARTTARELLREEKQNAGTTDKLPENSLPKVAPVKRMPLRKWLPYAAAACVVLFVAVFFLLQPPTPQQMAQQYIKENLSMLSHSMDGSTDSIQLGMTAYNDQQYTTALSYFEGVANNHPNDGAIKKYVGLCFLQLKNYDSALEQFKSLAAIKGLFSNEGDFLTALTLLQRDAPGDKEQAKVMLQKIVNENEDGSGVAKKWLEKW